MPASTIEAPLQAGKVSESRLTAAGASTPATKAGTNGRVREPNAIDFWRGFALITIFINHVPGNVFVRFTYSQYSLSDAAELFVFLAGWSLALATAGSHGPEPAGRVVLRLASRTLEVYRAQLVISILALAMIATAALERDNPLLLEWHGASLFFSSPAPAVAGLVALTYQLGYFNILPLYVGVLALAPIFILLARVSRGLAFLASFALYLTCLVFEVNLPNWPGEGAWFFNPLSWQFLLVLGYLGSVWSRSSPGFQRWTRRLTPLGLLVVGIGLIVAAWDLKPDPLAVPQPRLLFIFEKSYLSPGRLLHFLSLVIGFQALYALIAPRFSWFARQFSALGRNSLAVFSVASLVSLAGQFARFLSGGGFFVDVLILCLGIGSLIFTAWFVEWRVRSPRPSLSS